MENKDLSISTENDFSNSEKDQIKISISF